MCSELQGLAQRQLEHLLGSRGERDVPRRRRTALADDLFHLVAHGLERDAQAFERLGGDPFTFVDETEEDVFGADVAMAQQPRFLLCQHHDPPGPIGEAFKHGESLSASGSCNMMPFSLGPMAHWFFRLLLPVASSGGSGGVASLATWGPRRSSHLPA